MGAYIGHIAGPQSGFNGTKKHVRVSKVVNEKNNRNPALFSYVSRELADDRPCYLDRLAIFLETNGVENGPFDPLVPVGIVSPPAEFEPEWNSPARSIEMKRDRRADRSWRRNQRPATRQLDSLMSAGILRRIVRGVNNVQLAIAQDKPIAGVRHRVVVVPH